MYKLREITREDMRIVNCWRNKPQLISCLGAPFRFINLEVDNKWFDSYMSSRDNTVCCAIADEEEMIIGLISLTKIDPVHRSCTLHIMIGEEVNQNKGAGTYAVERMLQHAFNNLNLHRVELDVLATNTRAIKLYEKVGFIREGILRKACFKNGEYVDFLHYAILDDEYMNKGP